MPNEVKKYELAEKDYKKGMKYAEIATKYEVSLSTVKSWKKRYWSDNATIVKATTKKLQKNKKVATSKTIDISPNLTEAEQVFCAYYVEKWNGTQAILKSGLATNKKSAAKKANILDGLYNEVRHLKK